MSTYSNAIIRAAAALVIATSVLSISSCRSERQAAAPVRPAAEQGAVSVPASGASGGAPALSIEPRTATRNSTLIASAAGFSLLEAPVAWKVNGGSASSGDAERFNCSGAKKGDRIIAVAVVNGREVRSNEVLVGNTPPELSDVTLQPVMTSQGESFSVSASAIDADEDKVTIQYAWTVNDVPAGNSEVLTRALKRNDSVRVEVSAYDGQSYSERVTVSRTIANHPPVFIEHQDFTFSGGSVLYYARATDADGDQISYALASPVAGMTVDRSSGMLVWKVPDGFRGEQTATITADDGRLGTAQYTISFTIRD